MRAEAGATEGATETVSETTRERSAPRAWREAWGCGAPREGRRGDLFEPPACEKERQGEDGTQQTGIGRLLMYGGLAVCQTADSRQVGRAEKILPVPCAGVSSPSRSPPPTPPSSRAGRVRVARRRLGDAARRLDSRRGALAPPVAPPAPRARAPAGALGAPGALLPRARTFRVSAAPLAPRASAAASPRRGAAAARPRRPSTRSSARPARTSAAAATARPRRRSSTRSGARAGSA